MRDKKSLFTQMNPDRIKNIYGFDINISLEELIKKALPRKEASDLIREINAILKRLDSKLIRKVAQPGYLDRIEYQTWAGLKNYLINEIHPHIEALYQLKSLLAIERNSVNRQLYAYVAYYEKSFLIQEKQAGLDQYEAACNNLWGIQLTLAHFEHEYRRAIEVIEFKLTCPRFTNPKYIYQSVKVLTKHIALLHSWGLNSAFKYLYHLGVLNPEIAKATYRDID